MKIEDIDLFCDYKLKETANLIKNRFELNVDIDAVLSKPKAKIDHYEKKGTCYKLIYLNGIPNKRLEYENTSDFIIKRLKRVKKLSKLLPMDVYCYNVANIIEEVKRDLFLAFVIHIIETNSKYEILKISIKTKEPIYSAWKMQRLSDARIFVYYLDDGDERVEYSIAEISKMSKQNV